MRPLRHIIKDFYTAMSLDFAVVSHAITGSGPTATTSIKLNSILHLRAGLTVTIDSAVYTVLSVTGATIFTVLGSISNPAIVRLPRPIWFAGSPLSVNKKIDAIPTPAFKVPMVWLYEIIRERRVQEPDSMLERDASIRMFILDEADFSTWEASENQDDYYTKVIDGADRLAEYIKEQMYNSYYFGKFTDYTITSFAKFGVFTDNKGVTSSIFNDQLSGVELSLTLPVTRLLSDC